MKKLVFFALMVTLLLWTTASVMAGPPTTVNVSWLEDAKRYCPSDGELVSEWQNDPIPPAAPLGYIEFTKTGQAYRAGMEWFYNYYPLDDFTASPLVTSNGSFAAWARYTSPRSGLPILDKIRGQLTIVDDPGTAYGSYVQYSYVEGIFDGEEVEGWYECAVPTDDPDVWFIGYTHYLVHGQETTP